MKKVKDSVVGVDLAASSTNPTGWALLSDSKLSIQQLFADKEILEETTKRAPDLAAIDAPLDLPKNRHAYMREADKEMHRKGYHVLPPRFKSMEKLTLRASRIARQLRNEGVEVIEVHPLSSRRALQIPAKDWAAIQKVFTQIGLSGDLQQRRLTPHEIDAVTAALTGCLHLKRKTELIGNPKEGVIVLPKLRDWRTLSL